MTREDGFPLGELRELEMAVEETTGFKEEAFGNLHGGGEGRRVAVLKYKREEFEREERS